jgi:cytosine/adenosine deaminase-related metal-dependent hydrolase
MKGIAETGTTLLPFIECVVTKRGVPQEVIDQAIANADQEMQDAGIMACGDISNQLDTDQVKVSSPIRYYTFVEYFDMMHPPLTNKTIEQYNAVFEGFRSIDKNKKSKVPHAPYSVSNELFQYLAINTSADETISIHSEETQAELELFRYKRGGFIDLFGGFGVDFADFSATGKSSIHHALGYLNRNVKTIFVHNILTDEDGIIAANHWSDKVYWATCPNANLYIENRLPSYKLFLDQKMTIGTDSLTSNWQLSIWEEIKTIKKYCSYIPIEILLQWGTKNGAEALGFDNELGTIEVGKKPGFVHLPIIKNDNGDWTIIENNDKQKLKIN